MTRSSSTILLPVAFAIALMAVQPRPAFAADPVAESMFQEALELLRSESFEEACRLLAASYKLEKKSGTIVVLAHCNEQIGKTATAWAQYKEAAALARAERRSNHADKAVELAKKLEPRLSKLRIDAQAMQGGVALTVTLDGKVVVEGTLGVAFAVDPGEHVVAASAEGRQGWEQRVLVAPNGDAKVVAIPTLEPLARPAPTAPPALAPAPRTAPPPIPPPLPIADDDDAPPVWAWVTSGLGVAMMGAGVAFAVDQRAAASTLEDACGPQRDDCPPSDDLSSTHARERRDFGLFLGLGIGGAAATAVGVAGLFGAFGDPDEGVELSLGPGSMAARLRF